MNTGKKVFPPKKQKNISHHTYGSSNSNWYVKFQMFMSARAFWRKIIFVVFSCFIILKLMVSKENNNRQSCVDIHASVQYRCHGQLISGLAKTLRESLKMARFQKTPILFSKYFHN